MDKPSLLEYLRKYKDRLMRISGRKNRIRCLHYLAYCYVINYHPNMNDKELFSVFQMKIILSYADAGQDSKNDNELSALLKEILAE